MVVLAVLHAVQVEDVHMIGSEPAQRALEALGQLGGGDQRPVAARGLALVETNTSSRRPRDPLAHRLLGAIGAGGVDEADAEVEGVANNAGGVMRIRAPGHAQAAVSAAAEAGDTDLSVGAAETDGLHGGGSPEERSRL